MLSLVDFEVYILLYCIYCEFCICQNAFLVTWQAVLARWFERRLYGREAACFILVVKEHIEPVTMALYHLPVCIQNCGVIEYLSGYSQARGIGVGVMMSKWWQSSLICVGPMVKYSWMDAINSKITLKLEAITHPILLHFSCRITLQLNILSSPRHNVPFYGEWLLKVAEWI